MLYQVLYYQFNLFFKCSICYFVTFLPSALVIAFEKAKKKQQAKVKKLELQMNSMNERHNAQVLIDLQITVLSILRIKTLVK